MRERERESAGEGEVSHSRAAAVTLGSREPAAGTEYGICFLNSNFRENFCGVCADVSPKRRIQLTRGEFSARICICRSLSL